MAGMRLYIRILGSLSLLGGLSFFAVCAARDPYAPVTAKALIIPGVVFSILGVGLLLLRRSAAVVLSAISCPVGFWLIIGSLLEVPFPWVLINLMFGTAALLPLLVLILGGKAFKGW